MHSLQKLLAIAGVVRSVYGRFVIQHLLSQAVIVIGLSIVSAILVSVLLIGGFVVAYHALLNHGLTVEQAALAVAGLITLLTALSISQTFRAVRRMRNMPHNMVSNKSPISLRAGEVVDSFLEGFLNDSPRQYR